jgi:hypothetical protein
MKVWTTLKRLNQRFDCWWAHAADRIVVDLDDGSRRHEQGTKRHVSMWGLLATDRRSGTRGAVKGSAPVTVGMAVAQPNGARKFREHGDLLCRRFSASAVALFRRQ